MYSVRPVSQDAWWIGGDDRRLALFENVFPIPRGVSYNAYLLLDEKTVLLDTVDSAVGPRFFENLEQGLQGRKLDIVIVNHMEPDHSATQPQPSPPDTRRPTTSPDPWPSWWAYRKYTQSAPHHNR